MDNIQADSVKMNQEVETTQLDQSVMDTNVPHLVAGIKQELDNETKYNIQSQLPFLADKIKQEQMCIKSEEITSSEELYMKVRKDDRFDETMTELEKVEQPDLCGEDVGMHLKNELCAATWSYFTDAHTDVEKMKSLDSGQNSQLVRHDTVSEKLPEIARETGKNTGDVGGFDRLLVCVRKIVKNTEDLAHDLRGLPEYIHFEKDTENKAGSFEMVQSHTEKTILKTENNTGDLCLTSREQRMNESVKFRGCQVILEDIMAKNCSTSFKNGNCVSKKDTKHNVSSADSDKPSRYNVCRKIVVTFDSLNIHKRKHTGEEPYKRDVCGKGFTNTSYLNTHKMIHTVEKPYKCDVCGKEFTYSRNLYTHKKLHTGEKPYKCDVCGKCFTQNSSLDAHKRIHTGEKPYKCDVCDKSFTQNSSLIAHKTVHTGEKPYKCDVCRKSFPNASNLNTHKRMHTGEKPYECDVCGKVFGYTSSLHMHQRIHSVEKPYK